MNATRPTSSTTRSLLRSAFSTVSTRADRLQLRLHQLVAHQALVLGLGDLVVGMRDREEAHGQQPLGAVRRRVGEQLAELVEQPRHQHRLVLAELDQEPVARLADG